MDILSSLAVVTLAALIHASFQLSVSVLTLLSGHAIGSNSSRTRVLRLTSSFVSGVAMMTILLLSFLAFVVLQLFGHHPPEWLWAIACGLMVGIGLAVWLFYYRRQKGTSLWVPRGIAHFLSDRTKATKTAPEAFSLGMMSIVGELFFISAPLLVSALVLVGLPPLWQLTGVAIYAIASLLTLGSIWTLIGGGHKLSDLQRWREANKHFLQFAGGAGLIILGLFTYVFVIMGDSVGRL